ncbi:MAG: HlyD family efflux transporter periplasmic adaptor subunit [Bacteroidota bacterium]
MPEKEENKMISETESISQAMSPQFEIDDLIGIPPGWLLRSGIGMIAIVTFILLTGSYFFKYPDKLTGNGVVTSKTPPIEIVSRTSGYIDAIHVEESQEVYQGEPILFINNTTDKDQLIQFQDWIAKYEQVKEPKEILNLPFVNSLQLGMVQSEYANLQLKYNELQRTLKDRVVFQQINNLIREIEKIGILNESQQREKEIFMQELSLSRKNFSRNENLKNEGAISELEFEKSKTSLLQYERQYENMNNAIIQNNIRIEQLEMEKLKLKEQRSNLVKGLLFSISETITRIRSTIENWNETYRIEAPIDGKIAFSKDIVVKKNLNPGDVIGHIIPNSMYSNYVSAEFPSQSLGKIEKGQMVILKFDAYPHKEYGVVISSVEEISKLPELNIEGEAQYEIKIPLEEVVVTDYNDTIEYNPQMTVTAQVVTEDMTIFERLFDQFLSLLNQR